MSRRREHRVKTRGYFSLSVEELMILENLAYYLSMKKYGKPYALFISEALAYAINNPVKKNLQHIAAIEAKEHPVWKPPHVLIERDTNEKNQEATQAVEPQASNSSN